MSIHFISGKPGGGKSFYALKLIVDELTHTQRCIVTNLEVKIPELNAYVQERYPEKDLRVVQRVHVLQRDEVFLFWRNRGQGGVLHCREAKKNIGGRDISTLELSMPEDSGVLFVIDELHEFFNAREWANSGREALHYLSQHRKFGDDVVCITQSIGNVDKQFRSVAQDFTYLRNYGKERKGFFRLPALFQRSTYLEPFTGNQKSVVSGTFKLDIGGLAECYNTAAGAGVLGRGDADKKHKTAGLHWAWAVGAFVFLVALATKVPNAIGGVIGSVLNTSTRSINAKMAPTSVATESLPPVSASAAVPSPPPRPGAAVSYAATGTGGLWVTGYAQALGIWQFYLSDGTTLQNPEAIWTGRQLKCSDGRVFDYRPARASGLTAPAMGVMRGR